MRASKNSLQNAKPQSVCTMQNLEHMQNAKSSANQITTLFFPDSITPYVHISIYNLRFEC